MTSFIAARGSGRSTSLIPAVPAAWSVTTIAFIVHLLVCGMSWSVTTSHRNVRYRLRVGAGLVLGRAGAVCSELREILSVKASVTIVYLSTGPPLGFSSRAGATRARPERAELFQHWGHRVPSSAPRSELPIQ